MTRFDGLKEFDVVALGRTADTPTGKPRDLPISRIERDPDNIRKSFDEEAVAELAETIKADGLLQAITVRHHKRKQDFYVISYGERRYRAVCLLGLPTIAAVIDDNYDPYRQAIENLQREELDPLDIAAWIAKREKAGDSRTLIAKRLGKPKSYISEVSLLINAPPGIREAFKSRRIPDIRTVYLLVRQHVHNPDAVTAWLAGDQPITRRGVTAGLVARMSQHSTAVSPSPRASRWNGIAVDVAGRDGTMMLQPGPDQDCATVNFDDGSQEAVSLSKIQLKAWRSV